MAFQRKKTKRRLPWRVGPPTSEELAAEKGKAKPAAPPELAPKKRWPTDFIVTKANG